MGVGGFLSVGGTGEEGTQGAGQVRQEVRGHQASEVSAAFSPQRTVLPSGEAWPAPARRGSALGWLPLLSVGFTSGDLARWRGSRAGKAWASLDGFWRRERNWAEMLSRGLRKTSSASGTFASPREPWKSSKAMPRALRVAALTGQQARPTRGRGGKLNYPIF